MCHTFRIESSSNHCLNSIKTPSASPTRKSGDDGVIDNENDEDYNYNCNDNDDSNSSNDNNNTLHHQN